jgi:hypothetical protein
MGDQIVLRCDIYLITSSARMRIEGGMVPERLGGGVVDDHFELDREFDRKIGASRP